MTPCQHIFTLCLVRLPVLYGASNGRHHYYGTGKRRDEAAQNADQNSRRSPREVPT
jgi:hypothetical protein